MWENHSCDLIVLSHLRWDFVFQRPQHLLTRFAEKCRVFYVEEPIYDSDIPSLQIQQRQNGVMMVVPHLPSGLSESGSHEVQKSLVDRLINENEISDFLLWYYTPMAIPFTSHLKPRAVIYDCMDELSLFHGAPPQLLENEKKLFDLADVVFTGGHHLYEHKKDKHPNVRAFPSSIDFNHFHQARSRSLAEPVDQQKIPHPRIGFFGVIDERMDLGLVEGVALERPDWQIVILGPVVKIDPASLPRLPNIHYLGQKSYAELPNYIAGWDVAMLPFAKNESTRFISPTKTPEYLAAGKPVVSTSIRDVVKPYGENRMVFIADTIPDYVEAIDAAMALSKKDGSWLKRVDTFLSETSWDKTWSAMADYAGLAISNRISSELNVS